MSDAAWQRALTCLRERLSPQQFNTWIAPLTAAFTTEAIVVYAPNTFIQKWVKDRFWSEICSWIAETDARPVRLAVQTDRGAGAPTSAAPATESVADDAPEALLIPMAQIEASFQNLKSSQTPVLSHGLLGASAETGLLPELNFGAFVSGKANQLGLAAGRQVAENPGGGYNPLFVYGGVGLGKTHLVHAIGHHIVGAMPRARVRYMHSERYVQDVMKAYQRKAFDEFKSSYRALDVLIIDDIQFFEGKERTQEEFFYLFNTLIEARKQIILTSDTFPREITGIDERLKSRFGWGLTVQLEPPETEMRVAILLAKARSVSVPLDEAVAFFIAKQVRSNVRELEGALKRIIAYATFHQVPVSIAVAKEALKDLLAAQNRQVSVENIQKTVADYYKLKVADMHAKSRARSVARPRQVAMFLTKELTRLSLPEIGQSFGGRDHTTVLHACRQITSLRESDVDLQRDVSFLLQVLRS